MCHGPTIAITRIMEDDETHGAYTPPTTATAAVLLNAFGNSHYALIIATVSRATERTDSRSSGVACMRNWLRNFRVVSPWIGEICPVRI